MCLFMGDPKHRIPQMHSLRDVPTARLSSAICGALPLKSWSPRGLVMEWNEVMGEGTTLWHIWDFHAIGIFL